MSTIQTVNLRERNTRKVNKHGFLFLNEWEDNMCAIIIRSYVHLVSDLGLRAAIEQLHPAGTCQNQLFVMYHYI